MELYLWYSLSIINNDIGRWNAWVAISKQLEKFYLKRSFWPFLELQPHFRTAGWTKIVMSFPNNFLAPPMNNIHVMHCEPRSLYCADSKECQCTWTANTGWEWMMMAVQYSRCGMAKIDSISIHWKLSTTRWTKSNGETIKIYIMIKNQMHVLSLWQNRITVFNIHGLIRPCAWEELATSAWISFSAMRPSNNVHVYRY